MHFNFLSSILIAVAVGFAAQIGTVFAQNDVTDGARVFNDNCARCHNARQVDNFSRDEWSAILPHMRERAHMSGEETRLLSAFLSSLIPVANAAENTPQQGAVEGADAGLGEKLVQQFGCQGCHVIKGAGGSLGPKLDGLTKSKGSAFVEKKLRDPRFNNPASTMPKLPLTDADIVNMVKYMEQLP